MATAYSKIYGFVRAIVGDSDATYPLYVDEALQSQVDWLLIELNDGSIQSDPDAEPPAFTTDLTVKQQAIVSLRMAMNLVAPQANEFSFGTAVMRTRRSGATARLFSFLREKLDQIQGGVFAMAVDNDLAAVIHNAQRFFNDFSQAVADTRFDAPPSLSS